MIIRFNLKIMKNNNLSTFQRALVLISGFLLIAVLFVPLWQIDLDAPQYPEGLKLLMYPHKLGGDVEIINGLNHYIGMRTLHTRDFVEFTILPYIIGFFAAFCFVVFFMNRIMGLKVLFYAFLIFGIIAMFDFYRWEYNYGHNLDPAAPLQVPGMSYTPPLIGYKQLLNFAAYSIPHIGGVLFFGTGALLLLALIFPYLKRKKLAMKHKSLKAVAAIFAIIIFSGCSSGPKAIELGKDSCDFCKMAIADKNFGAEIITKKGKVFKFDDTHCLVGFRAEKMDSNDVGEVYLVNYTEPHNFIKAGDAILIKSDEIHSPMGGNVAAFDNEDAAQKVKADLQGTTISLKELYNNK